MIEEKENRITADECSWNLEDKQTMKISRNSKQRIFLLSFFDILKALLAMAGIAVIIFVVLAKSGYLNSYDIKYALMSGETPAGMALGRFIGDGEDIPATLPASDSPLLSYRSCLTSEFALAAYDSYVEAAENGHHIIESDVETWCLTYAPPAENEDTYELIDIVDDAIMAACYDHPMLSAYRQGNDEATISLYGNHRAFALLNTITESDVDILSMYAAVDAAALGIYEEAENIAQGDNEEFIRCVYEALARRIVYPDEDAESPHSNDIYGALVECKGKCAGMSCAFKYILDMAGIPNFIATGIYQDRDGAEEQHAWNTIYIDGQWKCCDITTGSYAAHNFLYSSDAIFIACLVDQEELLSDSGYSMDGNGYAIEKQYEEKQSNHVDFSDI